MTASGGGGSPILQSPFVPPMATECLTKSNSKIERVEDEERIGIIKRPNYG
jgi:hypothetical protein